MVTTEAIVIYSSQFLPGQELAPYFSEVARGSGSLFSRLFFINQTRKGMISLQI
jgi:hypothetical protein